MGKVPIQEFAKAIQFRAYYVVMQIILRTMTAKKTGVWLGSLATATGVPPIKPSLDDFHRITYMQGFACIQTSGEVNIFPINQVRAKHVADPGLQVHGKI